MENSSQSNRGNLTNPSPSPSLPSSLVSQLITSLILLSWLSQRRGAILARGVILGLVYIGLNLYYAYLGDPKISGWILPVFLACLGVENKYFLILSTGGSLVGMLASFAVGTFVPMVYAPAVMGSICLILTLAHLVLWIFILPQASGPARATLRRLIISLTFFACGIILMRIIEDIFLLRKNSVFLIGAFLFYIEGRSSVRSENMFLR